MPEIRDGESLLTYDDYALLPDDGQQYELIGGKLYVTPSPLTRHQRCLRELSFLLHNALKPYGEIFFSPYDVVFTKHDVVQPDLLFVLDANRGIITDKHITGGAPDLAIEILSPSTTRKDRELKRALYAEQGVGEYWIVDPVDHSVEKLVAEDGGSTSVGVFRAQLPYSPSPGVSLDLELAPVWSALER